MNVFAGATRLYVMSALASDVPNMPAIIAAQATQIILAIMIMGTLLMVYPAERRRVKAVRQS